jgi:hypothetical protein
MEGEGREETTNGVNQENVGGHSRRTLCGGALEGSIYPELVNNSVAE